MPYIAGYLLKLSLSLSVVYLFYILVLRRLTFYTWNRWYLLGYSLLAFLIPFVNISPVLQQEEWDKNLLVQLIPAFAKLGNAGETASQDAGFAGWYYLLLTASIGMVVMMARFLVRYISYRRIRRSAQLLADDGVKLYHVDKSIIPFSFGKAIFINRSLHAEEDLRQIIHHEFIHVRQRHTIDILWAECLCMLNWFNPFAWLIRKAIRQNLEFIADHQVLQNGIDRKHYQYLLLKVTGAAHFSITQQFNFSSLKKRIIMMNRSRSAKIQLTRFLFLLPLLTVMLLAFRSNAIGHKTLRLEVAALPDISNLFVEKTAMHADTVPVKDKKGEVKKLKLKQKPSDKAVDCDSVNASGNARIKLANENVLVVVDGVVQKQGANLKQINAEDIQEINVLKNAHAEEIYGHAAKGKDGVIEIVTKGHTSRVHNDGKVTILGDSVVFNGTSSITAKPSLNDVGKLYVVDGIELSAAEFEKLDLEPNRIESVTVLKGESATKIYGAKASKGAIIIKLKKVVTLSTPPEQKKNGSMPQISDN